MIKSFIQPAPGVFPTAEKEAKISPIHKCESKSLLDNYLLISVLNIFSKILESNVLMVMLCSGIIFLSGTNYMLSSNQYGLRSNRSTRHAVTILVNVLMTSEQVWIMDW